MSKETPKIWAKKIALLDTAETAELARAPYCFMGFCLETLIWAVAAYDETDGWACYIQTPGIDERNDVVIHGIKLHEDAARLIFPAWANRFTYRK